MCLKADNSQTQHVATKKTARNSLISTTSPNMAKTMQNKSFVGSNCAGPQIWQNLKFPVSGGLG